MSPWFCSISLLLAGMVLMPSGDARAAAYKCVDASGSTTYSQIPCEPEQETSKVLRSLSPKTITMDCRIARNFAWQTATDMRNGRSSDALFTRHGGLDSMPKTSIGVISYIFTYKANPDVSVDRITALTTARCQTGSFGPVACADFPYRFISDLGGCELASEAQDAGARSTKHVSAMTGGQSGLPPARPWSSVHTGMQPDLVEAVANPVDSQLRCKKRFAAQLQGVYESMRGRNSVGEQNNLQVRRTQLRKQLDKC